MDRCAYYPTVDPCAPEALTVGEWLTALAIVTARWSIIVAAIWIAVTGLSAFAFAMFDVAQGVAR